MFVYKNRGFLAFEMKESQLDDAVEWLGRSREKVKREAKIFLLTAMIFFAHTRLHNMKIFYKQT